jgi:hypothetical protein
LDQVGKTLDDAGRKSTSIARKLREVEGLPEAEADRVLTGDADVIDIEEEPDPQVELAVAAGRRPLIAGSREKWYSKRFANGGKSGC